MQYIIKIFNGESIESIIERSPSQVMKRRYCKYEVHNWFGYGSYKIFCENFIFFEGGDVVTGESNYRCRSVTESIA